MLLTFFFFFNHNFFFKTSLLLAIYSDYLLQMTGFDIHPSTHLDGAGGIGEMVASACSHPQPPTLFWIVPCCSWITEDFTVFTCRVCVGGWRAVTSLHWENTLHLTVLHVFESFYLWAWAVQSVLMYKPCLCLTPVIILPWKVMPTASSHGELWNS